MTQQHQKIVLFNGPPTVGKDTAADLAFRFIMGNAPYMKPMHFKMASALKRTTHQLYGVFESPEAYEGARKDEPTAAFFGKSARQAYIEVSEKMVKPVLGNDHWGRVAAVYLSRHAANNVFICSDTGFIDELGPLVMRYGPTNMLIVELVGTRDGVPCTFEGDSRSYIGGPAQAKWPGISVVRIPNNISTDNPDLTFLNTLVRGVVGKFLKIKDD